ncbi:lactonase family protein [Vibrio superstes]|uniref:3-carboxymuconate cyclase n=1 Tax=Vibrio superstes NBRC 103154 TaxID=1219062 RepID=A0A511QP28_9VIBR|nr:lactonase family protein [Vibrio superstes]GEM79091.1 3-carboxymuconate cyclase [Vibrio superstes NBRC 103154]
MKDKNMDTASSDVSRRSVLKTLGAVGGLSMVPSFAAHAATTQGAAGFKEQFVYIGTYSAPNFAPGAQKPSTAKGIYVYKLTESGELSFVQSVQSDNPSFLAVDRNKSVLYCVNELGNNDSGHPMGRVSAYKIDKESGELSYLNTQLTNGTWPCHCTVHSSGQYLLAANYGSGSFVSLPINADGSLGEIVGFYQSEANGKGSIGERQEGAHAHMIVNGPSDKHVFGVDLGTDKIFAFNLNANTGELSLSDVPFANVAAGAGPRHMDFHPSSKFAYVLNEFSSTIDVFDFDSVRGSFALIHSISTLPVDTKFKRPNFNPTNPGYVPTGTNTTAEIKVHPQGKWLYATNRGADSIAVYGIDQTTGKLYPVEWVSSGGNVPRGMNIDTTGSILLVGNQNSDNTLSFKIEPSTGKLGEPLTTAKIPVPVDFAFL